ncbi:MAG: SpoIIIAH-like family protein [Eubacteriales bacterium]|nr:SpoIIIAH-like family protein [Eubacteriales bacterium]
MEVVAQQPKKHHRLGKMKNFFGTVFNKKVRKIALMTGLLALLVVTGYLNFSLNQKAVSINAGSKTETNMFVTLKENRADSRSAQQMLLQEIVANQSASEEARAEAQTALTNLAETIAYENNTENLISAQCGYEDVIVSRNGSKLNVIVKSAESEISNENLQKIMKILATAMNKDRLEPENGDMLYISMM